ncbi:DNA mismatch repair protein MutS [Clostridium sp. 19966]|uniref:DNA mismatch repair protein MutS n=1 Tax=Clostridium sp. 19966 TaxID=2768166 RepID=UPI0028DE507C|nr:DNA mismatch repair protein MutS [Clostridium sp. 19966]MDT8716390.1 DNA mismatch repair protein MutS [Clostridium sp. 19966]
MALTPMMQQYLEVKDKCKDCILFYRLGDFYEMFFEDAEIASKELELVLTGRDCGLEERAPMCGIPYHAANSYIGRLISKGYKVAIGEQLEDPATAKGIVKRGIIKIITPGTFTDSMFLDDNKNNYIMSMYIDEDSLMCGLCFVDISTGECYATNFNLVPTLIIDEISKFSPKEILIEENISESIINDIKAKFQITLTVRSKEYFKNNYLDNLNSQFKNERFDNLNTSVLYSINGILNYILDTQKLTLSNITDLQFYNIIDYMNMDINTRKNLELTENIRDKSKKDSLLHIIDRTSTSMGSRMIRKWLEQPLINKVLIEDRLDAVEEIRNNFSILSELKEALKKVYDIERIIGKISAQSVNAKEMLSLKSSVNNIPKIRNIIKDSNSNLLSFIYSNLDELTDIYKILDHSIIESPSLSVKEGNIIKDGYNPEIDELRKAKIHGREWIASLENQEREFTGIKSLKVGYNKVFGYYIEISKSNYSSIPKDRYIRKQTLANAERFITEDLKVMEEKILGAEEKLCSLEYNVFVEIRNSIETNINRMKTSARLISEIDCITSLADVALENNYCKPKINEEGYINIKDGRHPVVEKVINKGTFICNDVYLNNKNDQMIIITGPNMAGKSTYMREVALASILTQIGSFIPASSADICICDRIFTRIGASDDLSSGKSTFMVEMSEVANILNNATNNSLVLLDEVGRGTSTYDGLSIAWAVIEYISNNDNLKCKTLFATHYHELTKLEGEIPGVKNYSVSVKEIGNEIVFLRKIVRGGADQSYGVEVAKLAGLPQKVIDRSKEILSMLEKNSSEDENTITVSQEVQSSKHEKNRDNQENSAYQMNFLDLEKNSLIKEISSIDILNLTPMDAMNKLYEIIKKSKNL